MNLFEGDIALPLFISDLVTLLLIVYFGQDRSRQRSAFKVQVARLEAKSLMAQMNPHFIYNTLNGIQSVMLLKGEEEANKYIGIFGRLLRKTLEMSMNENMSLFDEMNYLRDYIVLQNMRLTHPVQLYQSVPPIVEQKNHIIPPMLIQPIIENAILHGLAPLNFNGHIYLTIRLGEQRMYITVEDNGVGRKKAMENIRLGKSEAKPNSYATNILKERIDGFNYVFKQKSEFYLEDIIAEQKLSGTKATLILPKQKKKKKKKKVEQHEKVKDSIS